MPKLIPFCLLASSLIFGLTGQLGAQEDQLAAGRRALEAGDASAAIAAFQAALEVDGSLAPAWLGLSAASELEGDWVNALGSARRAVELAPDNPAPQLALSTLLARTGREAEALAAFERTRALAPELAEGYLLPGVMLWNDDRPEEASALLTAGFASTGDAAIAEQLGFLRLSSGAMGEALVIAEVALELAPDRGDLLLVKALALAADPDRRTEGELWIERALEAGVSNEGQARIERARLLAELERWPDAAAELERATALLPNLPEVFFRLSAARRQSRDLAGAQSAFERYEELNEQSVRAERSVREIGTALNEAQGLAGANKLDEALARLDAIEGGGGDRRVLVLRAKILFSLGRAAEALSAAAEAAALAPFEVEPAYLSALFAFAAGSYEESLTAIEVTLTLDSSLGEAWALRGSTLARLARLEAAIASFERALGLGFDSAQLRLDYAGVLSDLGRLEESGDQLEARQRLIAG